MNDWNESGKAVFTKEMMKYHNEAEREEIMPSGHKKGKTTFFQSPRAKPLIKNPLKSSYSLIFKHEIEFCSVAKSSVFSAKHNISEENFMLINI